MKKKKILPHH